MTPPKRWRSSCNIIQKWHQSSWNKIGQFIWYRSFDMKNLKWTRVNIKRIQVSSKKQKNIKTDGRSYSEIWSLDTSGRKVPVVSLMCILCLWTRLIFRMKKCCTQQWSVAHSVRYLPNSKSHVLGLFLFYREYRSRSTSNNMKQNSSKRMSSLSSSDWPFRNAPF
jgi:hypothetical protein